MNWREGKIRKKKKKDSFTCKFLKWWEAQSDFKKRQSAHFLGGWVIDVSMHFFIISFSLVMPIPTSDPLFICRHFVICIRLKSHFFSLPLAFSQLSDRQLNRHSFTTRRGELGKNNMWYIYIYMAISVKINQKSC